MFYSGVVHEVLTKDNYENWSACLKSYLLSQDLWDIVATESNQEIQEAELNNQEIQEAKLRTWEKKNATALHAIQISCSPVILSQIREYSSAKGAWDFLKKKKKTRQEGKSSSGRNNENYDEYKDLLKAVDGGRWHTVKTFIDNRPDALTAKLSAQGDTALHRAVKERHEKIVKEFVQLMRKEDLELKMEDGTTALSVAAALGVKPKIAEFMIQKNPELIKIKDCNNLIPVVSAAQNGRKECRDMTRYLYKFSKKYLTSEEEKTNGARLLVCCIKGEIFDVALDLLKECPGLAFVKAFAIDQDVSPVKELANSPSAFRSGSQFVFWRRWIYSCIRVQLPRDSNHLCIDVENPSQGQIDQGNILKSVFGQLHGLVSDLLKLLGIQQIYERKLIDNQARELLKQICISLHASEHAVGDNIEDEVRNALLDAAMHGIVEFVKEIIKASPELLECTSDEDERSIFMNAIVHRQEKIFSLIYALSKTQKEIFSCARDNSGNNLLHLAGMLAPSNRLDLVSGAALQMRRELLWFKVKWIRVLYLDFSIFTKDQEHLLLLRIRSTILKDLLQ